MNQYFDHDPNASILEDIDYKEPEIAGRGFRLLAYLIDAIFVGVIAFIIINAMAFLGINNTILNYIYDDRVYSSENELIIDLIYLTIFITYGFILEGSPFQTTIGKRILNMKVCTTECESINFKIALKRNVAKFIPFAVLVILFNSRNQGLHDRMADTLVVKRS